MYFKALEFIHDMNIAQYFLSIIDLLVYSLNTQYPLEFYRTHSMIILLSSGIQSHCAR